jgi:predicted nucleic acid-binding protein
MHKLKLPDAIIVATAIAIEAELLTNDRKLQLIPGVAVRSLLLKEPLP